MYRGEYDKMHLENISYELNFANNRKHENCELEIAGGASQTVRIGSAGDVQWGGELQQHGMEVNARGSDVDTLEVSTIAVRFRAAALLLLLRGWLPSAVRTAKMYSGQTIVLKNLRQVPPNTAKVIRLQRQLIEAVQRYQVNTVTVRLISLYLSPLCVCVPGVVVCSLGRPSYFSFFSAPPRCARVSAFI